VKNKRNEVLLSIILLLGIVAFGINEFFYNGTGLQRVVMNVSFLLAVSLPFVLYILFVTRRERNQLLDKIFVNRNTGLPNREKLRLDAGHSQAILYLINIDSFKEFNDFFGHLIGDKIIQEMAGRLKSVIHDKKDPVLKQGTLYKLESDEYAILVHHLFGRGEVIRAAEKISKVINENMFSHDGHELPVTVTVGIAFSEKYDNSLNQQEKRTPGILARADMALKAAKKLNYHYLVYENSLLIPESYEDNIQWTKKLKESIKKDRIVSFFQPIINNRTGMIDKFECLIRIIDDNENVLYPSNFLKISKRSRLYPELTKIILLRAFDEAERNPKADFSVNISVEDILNNDTLEFIYETLGKNPLIAARICFEILETEYIESIDVVKQFIRKVKAFHCDIAIDDFGFGYSNFNYLLELDIDYIKLDSSLIKNIHTNTNAYLITETIVSFCNKLGIRTIAEFVHSKEVYNIVKELGIDFSQGFYLGKPGGTTEGIQVLLPAAQ
jgi:diguanylate cyclase (GGDEF)-like protein